MHKCNDFMWIASKTNVQLLYIFCFFLFSILQFMFGWIGKISVKCCIGYKVFRIDFRFVNMQLGYAMPFAFQNQVLNLHHA